MGLPGKCVCTCAVSFSLNTIYKELTETFRLKWRSTLTPSSSRPNVVKRCLLQCFYCLLSFHPAATQLKFVLNTVNIVLINRLLSAVRSRIQDGFIYMCFPPVSRQPKAFPGDEYQSFKAFPPVTIPTPFHLHRHCSWNLITSDRYTLEKNSVRHNWQP